MARTPQVPDPDEVGDGGAEWDRIVKGKKAFPYSRAVTATAVVVGLIAALWFSMTTCDRVPSARPALFPGAVCGLLGK